MKNGIDAKYISSFENIERYILKNAKKGDIVVTMGAGNVYTIGEATLRKQMKKKLYNPLILGGFTFNFIRVFSTL